MKIKKWSFKIGKVLFITFLLLCLYLIVSSKLTGKVPQIGGYQVVSVLTGSMDPTIKSGSLILIKKVKDPETLHVNDIVTFHSPRQPNQLITHRIVDIEMGDVGISLSTKGDSNLTADARTISVNEVFGEYQHVQIPYVGYFLQFTRTEVGFVLFFVIPVLLLSLTSLGTIRSNFKHKPIVSDGGKE